MAAAESTLPDEPLLEAKVPGEKWDVVKETFTKFDKDGSGAIADWELREVFKTLGEDVTDQACRDLIKDVDEDEDGEVNFGEFCKVRRERADARQQGRLRRQWWSGHGSGLCWVRFRRRDAG